MKCGKSDFRHLFKGRVVQKGWGRQSESAVFHLTVHSPNDSSNQSCGMLRLDTCNPPLISCVDVKGPSICLSPAVFPGVLTGSWVRNEPTEVQTGVYVGHISGQLSHCASPTPTGQLLKAVVDCTATEREETLCKRMANPRVLPRARRNAKLSLVTVIAYCHYLIICK